MKKLHLLTFCMMVVLVLLFFSKERNLTNKNETNQFDKVEQKKPENKPEEKPKLLLSEAIEKIDKINLREIVEYLASNELEGRMSGKKGNKLAAAYIKKKFDSYELPNESDKFTIKRVNPGPKNEIGDDFTENVYAWIEEIGRAHV